jgi:hypothetical protein
MYKTQYQIIIDQLRKNKKVSRNWALNRRITRLGSVIKGLVDVGWKFDDTPADKEIMHGKFETNKWGERDYVYYLVSEPNRPTSR